MSQFALHQTPDELDLAVDQAIAGAGGDLRLAIRNLARRQHEFEAVISSSVSSGYVRRRPKR